MKQFFIWLSGADKDLVAKCSAGEQSRIINLGALILIPALSGLISMSFAISTFSKNIPICLLIGVLWFAMVLFIDRYLVSTFRKKERTLLDILSTKFIIRFVFAGFVGITVSHPLVLFIFNDTITQARFLEKQQAEAQYARKDSFDLALANKKLDSLSVELKQLDTLYLAEKNGVKIFRNGIQLTTGKVGANGKGSKNLEKLISQKEKEIETEAKKTNDNIKEINRKSIERINDYRSSLREDYITKVNTLNEIEKQPDKKHIKYVRWFLLIFFVFIDLVPLGFKVATDKKEYDIRHEESEEIAITEVRNLATMERKIARDLFTKRDNAIDTAIKSIDKLSLDHFLSHFKDIFNSAKFYDFIFAAQQKTEQKLEPIISNSPEKKASFSKKIFSKLKEDLLTDSFKNLIIGTLSCAIITTVTLIAKGQKHNVTVPVIFTTISTVAFQLIFNKFKEVETAANPLPKSDIL